jgi:hypothetical protein
MIYWGMRLFCSTWERRPRRISTAPHVTAGLHSLGVHRIGAGNLSRVCLGDRAPTLPGRSGGRER